MIYKINVRINGYKTLKDVKKFMELNKVKIIFFAETHGILDESMVQDKIVSQLKPTCYLYELLEEEKLISGIDFIKFLEKNDSERFSIISSFGELKPTINLAKKYNLPLIGCDIKNMYRKNKDFLKEIDKTEEERIMLNRERKQVEVIKKSLIQYGIPIFVSVGAFHLRKDSLLFKETELNHIVVYPLINDMKLEDLEENFNIKDIKKTAYVIESNKDGS